MRRTWQRWIRAAIGLAVAVSATTALAQEFVFAVNEGVTYHVTPYETREKYRDVAQQLAKLLKRAVLVQPVADYPTLAKTLRAGGYELAYIHPSHHALRAIRDHGYHPIATTKGFTDYKARFLVKSSARIEKAAQIRGRPMVMPDPDSITAWMVRATLRDIGLIPEKESIGTTRYQDGIPFMMDNGFYEVGITAANSVVKEWQGRGGKVLFESRPMPIEILVASGKLPQADIDALRAFFLSLDTSERGRELLAQIGFQGFLPADPQQLSELARWLAI